MKYMHFNSSCAYAGLANQLLLAGHSTEDEEIVRAIGLPWHIWYDEETDTYSSGAMLQGKDWFDLYLRPLGWEYEEGLVAREDVLSVMNRGDMIGVQLRPGWKHAVMFLERVGDTLIFLNNKHENSDEPEQLSLSLSRFMDMLPEKTVVGRLRPAEKEALSADDIWANSGKIWRQYKGALLKYIGEQHSFEEMMRARDPLFRALLVDTLAMMDVAREHNLASRLRQLQTQYLNALKLCETLVLVDHLDVDLLRQCLDELADRSE